MKNTQVKRYPFNMNKHQHDIFFRYNRAKNEYDDKCYNGTITSKEIDQYETPTIDILYPVLLLRGLRSARHRGESRRRE